MATWPLIPVVGALAKAGGTITDQLLGRARVPVLVGQGVDLVGSLWTYDHVDRILRGEVGPLRTDIFHPAGFNTAVAQGMGWLDAVLAWPLVRLLGVPGFYDLHLVLVLFFTTLALMALLRGLRAPTPVAILLSTLLMTSPWITRELQQGRITQAHLLFPVLFLLGLQRLVDGRGHWLLSALGAGLALAASALVYWFAAMSVGLLGAGVALSALVLRPQRRRELVAGGLVLSVVAVGLASWVAWPAVGPLIDSTRAMASHASDFTPITELPTLLGGTWSYGEPLVLVIGGLASMLVLPAWRRSLPWAVATLLVFTLPHGDGVALLDHALPSAFSLARSLIPLFHRLTWPSRTAIAPMLGLACTAAATCGWLWQRAAGWPLRRRAAWALCAVLLVVGLAERAHSCTSHGYILRMKPEPLQASEFYESVAKATEGGIIDIPVIASNSEYIYQIVHHRPILGGPGIDGPNTCPVEQRAYIDDNSFLRALEQVAQGEPEPPWDREDRQRLRDDGFSMVIVHEWKEGTDARGVEAMLGEAVLHGHRRSAFSLEDDRPRRRGRRPGRIHKP